MLGRIIKFLDVVSNELSYAAQVTNQWEELEQVSNALSNAVESRNEYKEQYESQQEYVNYLRGAYLESSEECISLSAKNDELLQKNEVLKAENEKLKHWESAYNSLLSDYYEVYSKDFYEAIDKQRNLKIFLSKQLLKGVLKISSYS